MNVTDKLVYKIQWTPDPDRSPKRVRPAEFNQFFLNLKSASTNPGGRLGDVPGNAPTGGGGGGGGAPSNFPLFDNLFELPFLTEIQFEAFARAAHVGSALEVIRDGQPEFGQNDFYARYDITNGLPVDYTFSGDIRIELPDVTGRDMADIEGLTRVPSGAAGFGDDFIIVIGGGSSFVAKLTLDAAGTGFNSSSSATLDLPNRPGGLAYDGTNLYVADFNSGAALLRY